MGHTCAQTDWAPWVKQRTPAPHRVGRGSWKSAVGYKGASTFPGASCKEMTDSFDTAHWPRWEHALFKMLAEWQVSGHEDSRGCLSNAHCPAQQ